MKEPFGLQDSSQGGLVENLKPFHLFLGCVPNLSSIQKDMDNSSLVDPDRGWGLDSSAVPYNYNRLIKICNVFVLMESVETMFLCSFEIRK